SARRSRRGWRSARGAASASALAHHAGDRQPAVMRERDVDAPAAEGPEALERDLVELEARLLAAGLDHLGVLPADAAAQARADRLERRLLGGEPCRQVGQRIMMGAAVGQLAFREEAFLHALAEALEGLHQPLDLDDVHADAP